MKKRNTLVLKTAFLFATSVFIISCDETAPKVDDGETKDVVADKQDSKEDDGEVINNVVKYKGEIFSIPSPIQTAILLREADIAYNPSILNDSKNHKSYVSQFQKALNLGVYGADLAYVSSYQNTQTILEYFGTVNVLTNDLQIKSDIGEDLISRFSSNKDNIDSLYVLNAEIYKAANHYLKESDRNETASLILAGGFIEALHISLNATEANDIIKARIGEQKSALNSLTKLLSNYQGEEAAGIIAELKDLKGDFDKLKYTYDFADPIHDIENKTTHLKSKTTVAITNSQLRSIKEKVNKLRTLIIS